MFTDILFEALVPAIVLATWLVCYLVKSWLDMAGKGKQIIPTVAAFVGIALGFATMGVSLTAFISGGVSGLCATGLNEVAKAFQKDTGTSEDE